MDFGGFLFLIGISAMFMGMIMGINKHLDKMEARIEIIESRISK